MHCDKQKGYIFTVSESKNVLDLMALSKQAISHKVFHDGWELSKDLMNIYAEAKAINVGLKDNELIPYAIVVVEIHHQITEFDHHKETVAVGLVNFDQVSFFVKEKHRRRGLATAMYELLKQHHPDLFKMSIRFGPGEDGWKEFWNSIVSPNLTLIDTASMIPNSIVASLSERQWLERRRLYSE